MIKIKDLPPKQSLTGVKVKTSKGVVGYWHSQWEKGVWLKDGNTSKVYPQFIDRLLDVIEWELTDAPVNCHKRTDCHSINNKKQQ